VLAWPLARCQTLLSSTHKCRGQERKINVEDKSSWSLAHLLLFYLSCSVLFPFLSTPLLDFFSFFFVYFARVAPSPSFPPVTFFLSFPFFPPPLSCLSSTLTLLAWPLAHLLTPVSLFFHLISLFVHPLFILFFCSSTSTLLAWPLADLLLLCISFSQPPFF